MSAVAASLFLASLGFGAGPLAAQGGRPASPRPAPTGALVHVEASGPNGLPGYQIVVATVSFSIMPTDSPDYGEKTVTALCPAGKVILGGGYYRSPRWSKDSSKFMEVAGSGPVDTGRGWAVQISNSSPTVTVSGFIRLYAICATKP